MSPIDAIAVVGGGAWGTALANAAAVAGRSVTLWLRDAARAEEVQRARENRLYLPGVRLQERVMPTAEVSALARSDAILMVVPAQSLRAALGRLKEVLSGRPLVICAKGIEQGTGRLVTQVAAECLPGTPTAILSGPSFAADVARGLPTAVTLASADGDLAARLAASLSGPSFRVYHGTDVRGVEIGGAAKNVLAIAAGIVEGRELGESAKAALVARGFAELLRFATAYGARPETLMGLSGLGDLVLTCTSQQSRNYAFGLRLGRGEAREAAAHGQLTEGAYTAASLLALARRAGVEMPIAQAVTSVLAGELSIQDAAERLMSRPLRAEL